MIRRWRMRRLTNRSTSRARLRPPTPRLATLLASWVIVGATPRPADTGFPFNVSFGCDGTTPSKIGALETPALEKNTLRGRGPSHPSDTWRGDFTNYLCYHRSK